MRFMPALLFLALAAVLLSCSATGVGTAPEIGSRPPLILRRPAVLCIADVTAMSEDELRRIEPSGPRPFRLRHEEIGRIANGFWKVLTDRLAAEAGRDLVLTGEPAGADYLLTVSVAAFDPHQAGRPERPQEPPAKPTPLPWTAPAPSSREHVFRALYTFRDPAGQTIWEGTSGIRGKVDILGRTNGLESLGERYGAEVVAILAQSRP